MSDRFELSGNGRTTGADNGQVNIAIARKAKPARKGQIITAKKGHEAYANSRGLQSELSGEGHSRFAANGGQLSSAIPRQAKPARKGQASDAKKGRQNSANSRGLQSEFSGNGRTTVADNGQLNIAIVRQAKPAGKGRIFGAKKGQAQDANSRGLQSELSGPIGNDGPTCCAHSTGLQSELSDNGQRGVADNGRNKGAIVRQTKPAGRGHCHDAQKGQTVSANSRGLQSELSGDGHLSSAAGGGLPCRVVARQAKPARKGQSKFAKTNGQSECANSCGTTGAGQSLSSGLAITVMPASVSSLCADIKAMHRERCFALEQRKSAGNALGAYIRTQLGWHLGLDKPERKRIEKAAKKIIAAATDARFALIIEAAKQSVAPFKMIETSAKKRMAEMAEQLPLWRQFESVRGFGAFGLAIIIGEAGDLRNYPTHSKLWKRMGVAVFDGLRQGGLPKGSAAENWIRHGYSPRRRSRLWTIGESLIKGNRSGRYRTIYLARKKFEIAREPDMRPIHAHRRAQRYMEKRLLRDLWQQRNVAANEK